MSTTVAWASCRARPRGLTTAVVRRAAAEAAEHGGRPGIELSIVFVDDRELAALHARWLDDPTPTDVITFDLGDEGVGPAGELFVSTERARAVARARRLDLVREHLLYVVHGVLHLCGYDDRSAVQRRRMRAAERRVLAPPGHAAEPVRRRRVTTRSR